MKIKYLDRVYQDFVDYIWWSAWTEDQRLFTIKLYNNDELEIKDGEKNVIYRQKIPNRVFDKDYIKSILEKLV